MSVKTFKIGDVVRLQSGGPDMSVKQINASLVTCQWFAGKKLEQGVFNIQTLIHAPEKV
jgi:uncharacterized protein YodC (DUF2158 family)